MLQVLTLATQSSNVFKPGKDPFGAVLQSPPYEVGPQVPLLTVPTGKGDGGAGDGGAGGGVGGGGGGAGTTAVAGNDIFHPCAPVTKEGLLTPNVPVPTYWQSYRNCNRTHICQH